MNFKPILRLSVRALYALIHPNLRNPQHPQYLKAKIYAWAIAVIMVFVPFYDVYFLVSHPNDLVKNLNNLYGLFNLLTAILLLRFSKNVNHSIRFLLFSGFPPVMISIYITGGLYSADMIWLLCFIMGAFIFVDTIFGIYSALICLAFAFFLYFITDESKDQLFKEYVLSHGYEHGLIAFTSVVFLITGFLFFYNRNLQKAALEIERLNQSRITELQQKVWQKVQEISNLRSELAKDFHDEMGNRLASINILSQAALLCSDKESKEELHEILDKIAYNSRDVLQKTKEFIWSVDYKSEYAYEFYLYMREFGESFLQPLQLNFQSNIHFDENLNIPLPLPIGRQLMFICKEIITNAAKHSGGDQVKFDMLLKDGFLCLQIRDNGKGFQLERVKKGGLENIYQRAGHAGINVELKSDSTGSFYSLLWKL